MQEKIIQTKTCKKCSAKFDITDKDLEFYKKVSPKFDGKVYEIPTPTLCPDCRQQRRLAFRNERKLYKRKCDATGESIISVYSSDKPFKVYNHNFWWSDKWEPLDYGIDFDFSKSFFEQFKKLFNEVPKLALIINNTMENSSFANYGNFGKNIYMGFVVNSSENIYYSYTSAFCNYDVDGSFNKESENLYECIGCNNSYKLFYSKDSENCKNSYFLHFCKNCENCFGCVNLINKKYCIFNKQYSKEEYFKKIKEILNKNIETIKDEFFKLKKNNSLKI